MPIEIFLNELSWENKIIDFIDSLDDITTFRDVLSLLDKQKRSYKYIKLILDKPSLDSFLKETLEVVEKDKALITNIERLIYDKLNAENWKANPSSIPSETNYYLYLDLLAGEVKTLNTSTLAQAVERSVQYPDELYLIINFSNSKFSQNPQIDIIKDDFRKPRFLHLDYIENKQQLEEWLNNFVKLDSFLKDVTRFEKTKHIQQGKTVYLEKDTGYYWYFDNFHKDPDEKDLKILVELEVFDKNGVHIGVSDLQGNIDKDKRKSRTIDIK
jgi:hypothetical protein